MGIVRRCGRPPRTGPGPLIQKPTRERVPVRIAAAVGAVDRRLPPRIPVLPIALRAVEPVAALDREVDAVICSCRGHAAVTAVR
jgi:hypothetical protein